MLSSTPTLTNTPPWWSDAVVYQIYPRSFSDSNGDGIGDIGGITNRLDYLQSLGVDVIWLSPIYRSPQDDNGYDISDYQDIDPTFGTIEQFDQLLEAAHSKGMKLVMDLVVNHTSDEHPWFLESRSCLNSPKRDWYWWRKTREGMDPGAPGAEPTNWASAFSGPAWTLDEDSGEYYLHLFSPKQPDLNWENPDVRHAIYAMMRWWLDRGVDGFRMDVINLISKDASADGSLHDGPPLPGTPYGNGARWFSCGPRIHEFLQEMHREVFAGRDADLITVGEMPGVTVEDAVLFTDPARAEVDMVFQFEHVDLDHGPGGKFDPRPLRLTDLKASLGRWQQGLEQTGWNSLYWNNHDQPRVVSRFGDDHPDNRVASATCLATLLHLHRGTPYIYQGEELGMTNAAFDSIEDFRDIESINYHHHAVAAGADPATVLAGLRRMGRDNARTPMQWDTRDHAGFTTGTPWISVNPNYTTINADDAQTDQHSVFHHYRRLIELRHTEPAVSLGDFTMLLPHHEQVYAFTRGLDDVELLVLANVSGEQLNIEVPNATTWEGSDVIFSNHDTNRHSSAHTGFTALAPWEVRVHRRTRAD